jgi:hypothetical protein
VRYLLAAFVAAALFPAAGQAADPEWHPLFDGKSLAGWKPSDFFGAGKVTVENGAIVLGNGFLTGITWAGKLPFPNVNYEIRVEAARMAGSDFFAGITFPIGEPFCTWINGGWGGQVVGLSSLDGEDASQNESTTNIAFERGRFYTFRLRVAPARISAWIDNDLVIDVDVTGRWISLREGDIDKSVPFGIAAYSTVAAIRKIEWRELK